MTAKPLLKWVGGKTQLLGEILKRFPSSSIETYYEPFIGGAAVFFALANEARFRAAHINDWNPELVNCYKVVKESPNELMDYLRSLPLYHRETFETLRQENPHTLDPVKRAGRMIYLNKNGFNGLYRENKKGQFNVPFGKFASPPRLFDKDVLLACSKALASATITQGDFSQVCEAPKKGDLVYFDPPYVPATVTSSFTSYTAEKFGLPAQQRLAQTFRALADKGVALVLSNSDTELVRSLYEGFEIVSVQARRNVNSKGDKRGTVGEVLVLANQSRSPSVSVYCG